MLSEGFAENKKLQKNRRIFSSRHLLEWPTTIRGEKVQIP